MVELNIDGLVGPTHNYAGLSEGNVASRANALAVSQPRQAALQGLAKMEHVAALGLPQAFLPPHERPAMWALRRAGFGGSDAEVLARVAAERPALLAQCCSASAMWTANAATAAPAIDTTDGRTHLMVANLRAMPHRRLEPEQTLALLQALLPDRDRVVVHAALPSDGPMGDEGAANHTRLLRADGTGVHIFVFGARSDGHGPAPTRFPARQTLEASQAVARTLHLDADRCVFVQQSPQAIDAGVFHNDVIAVGSERTLLHHQDAYLDTPEALRQVDGAMGGGLVPVQVHRDELTVAEAVQTYLFNSQLLHVGHGNQMLVCPSEVEHHPRARAVVDRVIADPGNPIHGVMYLDVRESMRNGGGPACVRLRLPIAPEDLQRVHSGFLLTPDRAVWLRGWISRTYPERLEPADLGRPELLERSREALQELSQWIGAGPLHPFQHAAR
jgi:succinylarginine dihydrolase